MSDRIKALTVHLEADYDEATAEQIATAINMIKGVAAVEPHKVDIGDHLARSRVKRELLGKVVALFE